MRNERIGIFDSGIGGMSVLKKMVEQMPNNEYLYLSDNKNLPYGDKTKNELLQIASEQVNRLLDYGVDKIVIGCNTLSVNVLEELREKENVKIFGVFPPVKEELKSGHTVLLLATERTCEKFLDLTKIYKNKLKIMPLPNLASDIERNKYNVENIDINLHIKCPPKRYESVILGCTHYEFIKYKIFNHLKPLKITSGVINTVLSVKSFCANSKKPEINSKNQIVFIGDDSAENYNFWTSVVKNIKYI